MPMPNTKMKPMPEFQSEEEEREFGASHDSTEFIDWRSARRRTFPNLKPTLRTISLRLPVYMIEPRLQAATGIVYDFRGYPQVRFDKIFPNLITSTIQGEQFFTPAPVLPD